MTALPAGAPAGRDAELLRALGARIEQHDPGAFNNLGVLYFSKGLLAEAVDAFLRALALDPRMRVAARNLEIAAAQPGACEAQLAVLDARLAADPDDADALRQRARLLRLIGRQPEAVAALDTLIAADPDDAAALFERGLVEQGSGDLRRAQRWFERAVNASPDDATPRLHLAEVLYHRGQNEQALRALDLLLAISAEHAEAHLLRGFVLGDMGYHEAGLAAARQAASLNPALGTLQSHLSLDSMFGAALASTPATGVTSTSPGAHAARTAHAAHAAHAALGTPLAVPAAPHGEVLGVVADGGLARYGLGLAFRQRGYFEESRREFLRARENGEDPRLVAHAIAELDLLAGHFTAACEAYDALLAQDPASARHWNERGVALHQGGDVLGAADSYRRALRVDPRFALAYNNLGVALEDLGETAAAREALVRAAELEPALVRVRLNVARWHARHRDALAALALLRELVAFHGGNADVWHEMGLVLQTLDRPEDARDAFAAAIERRPGHAEARYALADVLSVLGDGDGALRETQQALGLSPLRASARLLVAIDLQEECPEAAGALDLLAVGAETPLEGFLVDEAAVSALLPDARGATGAPVAVDPASVCDEADGFAARGVHGEALERYRAGRLAVEQGTGGGGADELRFRACVGEARSLCLLGDGGAALSLLRTLGSDAAGDPQVLVIVARSAADAGSPDVTRAALRRLLRLDVTSAALLHFAGDAAARIDEETYALVCYRRALALDPSRPSPRVAIARLLRARGDHFAARLELVAALAIAPDWVDALLELAQVHLAASRVPDAMDALTRVLGRHPANIAALVLLGEALMSADRDEDARVSAARALRHAPDDLGARWLEGALLARQGRVRDARTRWQGVAAGGAASEELDAREASYLARAAGSLALDVDDGRGATSVAAGGPRARNAGSMFALGTVA